MKILKLIVSIILLAWISNYLYKTFFLHPYYEERANALIKIIEKYKEEHNHYPTRLEDFIECTSYAKNEMCVVEENKLKGKGNFDYAFYDNDKSYFLVIGDYYSPNITFHSSNNQLIYDDNTLD